MTDPREIDARHPQAQPPDTQHLLGDTWWHGVQTKLDQWHTDAQKQDRLNYEAEHRFYQALGQGFRDLWDSKPQTPTKSTPPLDHAKLPNDPAMEKAYDY